MCRGRTWRDPSVVRSRARRGEARHTPDTAALLETPRVCAALAHGKRLGEPWRHRPPLGRAATAQGGKTCRIGMSKKHWGPYPCSQHALSDAEVSHVSLVVRRASRWAFWSAAQAL